MWCEPHTALPVVRTAWRGAGQQGSRCVAGGPACRACCGMPAASPPRRAQPGAGPSAWGKSGTRQAEQGARGERGLEPAPRGNLRPDFSPGTCLSPLLSQALHSHKEKERVRLKHCPANNTDTPTILGNFLPSPPPGS